MAKLYWDLIKMNLRTVDQVPLLWREDVQALLDNEVKKTQHKLALFFIN
ncbi:CD1375 family protein [Lysinibacillus fusiformis]|nr:CD1375 family protein [Lysinibacillus fusiformis]MED4672194.1 CD1375 family protein [Lysinibacillus fusiformis]